VIETETIVVPTTRQARASYDSHASTAPYELMSFFYSIMMMTNKASTRIFDNTQTAGNVMMSEGRKGELIKSSLLTL
jgi:hypothetical protein